MLVVETNLKAPGDIDVMRIEVRQGGLVVHALDYSLTPYTLPATLGLVEGTRTDPVDVRVIARKGSNPVVVVDLRTTVPPDRVAALPVFLDAACVGKAVLDSGGDVLSTCGAGQTCKAGQCVSTLVDSSTLPNYTPGASFASDAGVTDGGDAGGPTILLSAAGNHTCAAVNGVASCWGDNAAGQLGDGGNVIKGLSALRVKGLPAGPVTAISCGFAHSCAIVGGDVYCWGAGSSGQLGDGKSASSVTPVKVTGLAVGQATDVRGGDSFTCAAVGGKAYCWGAGGSGQLGNGASGASP
jgi:alpha-tubulin suppressor-like RCC1 family protein